MAIGVCVAGAVVATVGQPIIASRLKALIWADAAGLGVFAILGAQAALTASASPVIAVFMAAVTATFGGVVRDVLCNEVPLVLRQEIYATAALVGGGLYVGLLEVGVPAGAAAVAAALLTFAIRAAAIVFKIQSPKFGRERKNEL